MLISPKSLDINYQNKCIKPFLKAVPDAIDGRVNRQEMAKR